MQLVSDTLLAKQKATEAAAADASVPTVRSAPKTAAATAAPCARRWVHRVCITSF
jgi:hypothetical protein